MLRSNARNKAPVGEAFLPASIGEAGEKASPAGADRWHEPKMCISKRADRWLETKMFISESAVSTNEHTIERSQRLLWQYPHRQNADSHRPGYITHYLYQE
jgi:hypothetical protein